MDRVTAEQAQEALDLIERQSMCGVSETACARLRSFIAQHSDSADRHGVEFDRHGGAIEPSVDIPVLTEEMVKAHMALAAEIIAGSGTVIMESSGKTRIIPTSDLYK